MLAELATTYDSIEKRFALASEVLGFDLWAMAQNGPNEDLSATENTQPVLLTASYALWEIWQAEAPAPAFVAGHSLGEYSALCCADAIDFVDAVALVRKRGQLMEAAVPRGQGAMAAIMGLEDDQVASICDAVNGVVVAANFNAPGQVVIAGAAAAVDAAATALKDAGAKRAVMLDVSGPFHSPLMAAAKDEFALALEAVTWRQPSIPVVQNVDAKVATDLAEVKDKLLQQLAAPVLWSGCVQEMVSQGVDLFVECGPGAVLSGLNRRIAKQTTTQGTAKPESLAATIEATSAA